jgi:hypothetical protein
MATGLAPYTKTTRQAKAPGPSQQYVQLSPPARAIRKNAGLGTPTAMDILDSVGGVAAGGILTAFLIGVVPGASKWPMALLGSSLGMLLAATSPIGTTAQEVGLGAFAVGAGWAYFDLTGQFAPTSPATPSGLSRVFSSRAA